MVPPAPCPSASARKSGGGNGNIKSKTIIIMTPDNKKHKNKATKHTCGIQILEQICHKKGLNPAQWQLKHGSTFAELSHSMPFLALPENVVLNLVKLNPERKQTTITVLIQMEDGRRLKRSFFPSVTIWSLLCSWEEVAEISSALLQPTSAADGGDVIYPTCVYLRRTLIGEEELMQATLKDLGLIKGSACIRFRRLTRAHSLHQAYAVRVPHQSQSQSDLESMSTGTGTEESQTPVLPSPREGAPGQFRGIDTADLEAELNGLQLDDDILQRYLEGNAFKRAFGNLKISDEDNVPEIDNSKRAKREENTDAPQALPTANN